ncbi:ECF transporter S component [Helcococcus kunzii]|uniref:ECF transporter S component n=1 Tax=Helcococcus kunzii TaxID=40091 RepID=UPI0038AF4C25
MKKNTLSLQDVIMVSILSVVLGVVYLGAVYFSTTLVGFFTPMGIGFMGYEIVFGIWLMAATLAAYIIQKPGVAIITEVLAAVIEVLLGNFFGPMVIVSGIVQGLGAEVVFAGYGYRKWDHKTVYLAAIGTCITSFIWSFIRSGYGSLSLPIILLFFVVRIISTLILAGYIPIKLVDKLSEMKLLKSYSVGK